MTSENPIIVDDDEAMEWAPQAQNQTSDLVSVGSKISWLNGESPMIVDQGAMERPLYTGVEQWAAIRQAAAKGGLTTTTSTGTGRPPQTPSTPESSSPQIFRRETASSYLHVPLQPSGPGLWRPPPLQQPSAATLTLPARWHIPPQPVCKGGERPTPVCGKYSPALRDPPKRPRTRDTGAYRCPRCHAGYVRTGGVRGHFPRCVALNGNPDCDAWTDHDSCVARKSGPVYLVPLGPAELIIRTVMHPKWVFSPLQPPTGGVRKLPTVETKEEQDEALGKFAKDLKDDIRTGLKLDPQAKALIQLLNEDGQWNNDTVEET